MNNRIEIEISYQKTVDDKIIVTDFKMLTKEEIRSKYGSEVFRLYFDVAPYCYKNSNILQLKECYIHKGNILTKDHFEEVISECRAAGKRLATIRKQVAAYETKTIII